MRANLMRDRLFLPPRRGHAFVAIGALHLYGDEGLLALLKEGGYRVIKVW